jgi:nanoRNase/pAp phosphatase (c-di-AMP/oligoRNAs hydrolase)
MLNMLRKSDREAFTLPLLAMYKQIVWILDRLDFHPSSHNMMTADFVTPCLQEAYDELLEHWTPDEILLVDGPLHKLGFDPRGVKVFTIDHHVDGQPRDDACAYVQYAPSAGCLLIEHYGIYDPVLSVSILTDTYWLRQNAPAHAAHCLDLLVDHGLTDDQLAEMQRKLMVRKNFAIVLAIQEADLRTVNGAVFAVLRTDDKEIHRGVMSELNYFGEHLCVVRGDGYVSLKTSDLSIDFRSLAHSFDGGGHQNVAACVLHELEPGSTADPVVRAKAIERLYAAFLEAVSKQSRAA